MSQPSAPPSPAILAGIAAAALLLGVGVFWSRSTPADVKEWTSTEHDQPPGQAGLPPPGRQKAPHPQQQDASALADLAWSKSCAACHGERGRGDGPQGAMVRAPDLTRAEWQGRVTDDDIRETIRTGRNSMPKFDLPPAVLDGLVKRIRANRAK
jgi:cytochrome c oxidase cbb3-type subunit 3